MGRRAVAVTTTLLTGWLIVHGAGAVYRDVFGVPDGPAADATCAEGIRRLHHAFTTVWQSRRSGEAIAVPPNLERDLRALRPVCEREGEAALDGWEHLARWRYRAEGQSALWRETLHHDAERALGYAGTRP